MTKQIANEIEKLIKAGEYKSDTIVAAMIGASYGRRYATAVVRELAKRGVIVADGKSIVGNIIWRIVGSPIRMNDASGVH